MQTLTHAPETVEAIGDDLEPEWLPSDEDLAFALAWTAERAEAEREVPVPDGPNTGAFPSLADWIAGQASYYRSRETDAAELVARALDDLASEVKYFETPGQSITADEFEARREAFAGWLDFAEQHS